MLAEIINLSGPWEVATHMTKWKEDLKSYAVLLNVD